MKSWNHHQNNHHHHLIQSLSYINGQRLMHTSTHKIWLCVIFKRFYRVMYTSHILCWCCCCWGIECVNCIAVAILPHYSVETLIINSVEKNSHTHTNWANQWHNIMFKLWNRLVSFIHSFICALALPFSSILSPFLHFTIFHRINWIQLQKVTRDKWRK